MESADGGAAAPSQDRVLPRTLAAGGPAQWPETMDNRASDHFIVRVLQPATDAFFRVPDEDDEESRLRNGAPARTYSQEEAEADR